MTEISTTEKAAGLIIAVCSLKTGEEEDVKRSHDFSKYFMGYKDMIAVATIVGGTSRTEVRETNWTSDYPDMGLALAEDVAARNAYLAMNLGDEHDMPIVLDTKIGRLRCLSVSCGDRSLDLEVSISLVLPKASPLSKSLQRMVKRKMMAIFGAAP